MIAEALVEARHHGELDRHGKRHRPRYDLGGQCDVEIIELVVQIVDGGRRAGRPLGEGIARAAPDCGRHLAHAFHQAAAAG